MTSSVPIRGLTAAQERIVHNAAWQCSRFLGGCHADREDLAQEGRIAVLRFACKIDPQRDEASARAYLRHRVVGVMQDYVRANWRGERSIDGMAIPPAEELGESHDPERRMQLIEMFNALDDARQSKLSDNDKLVALLLLDGMDAKDVAKARGVTGGAISHAKARLRKFFGRYI